MVRVSVIAALIVFSLLTGCATPYSEAPLATNFPTSGQPKLQAAAHWNVIAIDVASQISARFQEKPPLYVNQSAARTAFDRAFANQLISALVAHGFTILKTPANTLNVEIDTQAVLFSANRPQYRYAGAPAALAAGVWALHQADARAGAALLASVAIADAYSWFQSEFATGATPQMEIIVTISVADARQYVVRSTNIYYVADGDSRLYVPSPPPAQIQTRNIEVTGP